MQRPALTDKLLFLIKWLFEQSATENNHQLYYDWPSIHNSILKICSKFQVPSVHFSEVNDLLDEHWVKNVQSKNILCVALWSRKWLWNGSKYWSWRSLRRHDLISQAMSVGRVSKTWVPLSCQEVQASCFKLPCFRHSDARQIGRITQMMYKCNDGATMALLAGSLQQACGIASGV